MNRIGIEELYAQSYICGHCGKNIASDEGFLEYGVAVYICCLCKKPTIIEYGHNGDFKQIPGIGYGDKILYLPEEVEEVYEEARKCISINAFSSSILCCRKILMNCAVEKGAEEGKKFIYYIDFLQEEGYIPPHIKDCIDEIRKLGNQSTHKIQSRDIDEAKLVIDFTAALLKIIYEMPGKLSFKNKIGSF